MLGGKSGMLQGRGEGQGQSQGLRAGLESHSEDMKLKSAAFTQQLLRVRLAYTLNALKCFCSRIARGWIVTFYSE